MSETKWAHPQVREGGPKKEIHGEDGDKMEQLVKHNMRSNYRSVRPLDRLHETLLQWLNKNHDRWSSLPLQKCSEFTHNDSSTKPLSDDTVA